MNVNTQTEEGFSSAEFRAYLRTLSDQELRRSADKCRSSLRSVEIRVAFWQAVARAFRFGWGMLGLFVAASSYVAAFWLLGKSFAAIVLGTAGFWFAIYTLKEPREDFGSGRNLAHYSSELRRLEKSLAQIEFELQTRSREVVA